MSDVTETIEPALSPWRVWWILRAFVVAVILWAVLPRNHVAGWQFAPLYLLVILVWSFVGVEWPERR